MIPEEELRHLAQVEAKIQKELANRGLNQEDLRQALYEKRKYLWQELVGADRPIQDQYERTAQETDIRLGEKNLATAQQQEYQLKKLRDTPYFARVDFQEDGFGVPELFYIGKFGLTDMESFEQVICDWRSDVAALYYNFGPGRASFTCPNGEITGDLTRKRQFQIERGQMLGCFDTALSIEDQFLQRILNGHAGEQMKTIVDSIQESQNRIIRDTEHNVVIINGCAGSGKTSVALHRIAYLLYHTRSTLRASDCMIFSPNTLFEDYIASVLPDLGEDNVWQTTFADFASGIFGSRYEVRTFLDAVSERPEPLLAQKGSSEFAQAVRDAAAEYEANITFSDQVFEGEVILSATEQAESFRINRATLPYRQSVNRLKNQLIHRMRTRSKELRKKIAARLVEENGLSAYLSERDLKISARLAGIHICQRLLHEFDRRYVPNCNALYAQLLGRRFGAAEQAAFEQRLAQEEIHFSDAAPLLYLMQRLGMLAQSRRMRQIVIDEAQDYTDLQYALLLDMYPHAVFTVLGDPEQTLSGCGSFREVLAQSGRSCAEYTLDINYRSSKEIVAFTNQLAGRMLCHAVERSAGAVRHCTLPEAEVAAALNEFLNASAASELAAVVCADAADCEWVFRALNRADACLLTHEFAARSQRICVLTVPLAKGLEFDRVAVVNRAGKLSGGRLYVACTRALHQLMLINTPAQP